MDRNKLVIKVMEAKQYERGKMGRSRQKWLEQTEESERE